MVISCGSTLTLFLISFIHFTTLIHSFRSGGDKTRGGVLKYVIVRVSSLWLCDTNSSKRLVTTSRLTFLVLYHLNSVISVVRGP